MPLPSFSSSTPQASFINSGKVKQTVYNVRDYGAKGDGTTDDLAAINAAIAAAYSLAGTVYFPPTAHAYAVSNTISITASGSGLGGTTVPSLVADSVGGYVGDISTETSQVTIIPTAGFPQGNLLLDYTPQGADHSLNGANVRGITFKCGGVSAGVRVSNVRRFRIQDINISHPALPALGGLVTGGFNVMDTNANAPYANLFENIEVDHSAGDGFVYNSDGNDTFLNCFDFNSAPLGSSYYAWKCMGLGRFIACHYESSSYGWYVECGNQESIFFGCDYYGIPQHNAVTLTSNGATGLSGEVPLAAKFIACNLINGPTAPTTEANDAVIRILNTAGTLVIAEFIGCDITGDNQGGYATTDYVYVDSAVPNGSQVSFTACNFSGPFGNTTFNDASGNNVLSFFQCRGIPNTGIGMLQAGGAATTTGPTASLDAAASTTSNASLRIRSGTAPTSPNSGDVWNDGTNAVLQGMGLKLASIGSKINIATGSNASAGTGTLIGGTATIATTAVTANSLIFLQDTSNSITNVGTLTAPLSGRTAGTSFVVTSTLALDTSTFNWLIIN